MLCVEPDNILPEPIIDKSTKYFCENHFSVSFPACDYFIYVTLPETFLILELYVSKIYKNTLGYVLHYLFQKHNSDMFLPIQSYFQRVSR